MKRSGPIKSDPAKNRAWQQRGARAYADRQRESNANSVRPESKPLERKGRGRSTKRKRNDSGWRAEVMARYGPGCVRCGDYAHVQADHIWPRSQGGPSEPENGLPLCGEFSRNTPGGCHTLKTASAIVIEPAWLADDQIEWLAKVGWVEWDVDGQPFGRGFKHFAPQKAA